MVELSDVGVDLSVEVIGGALTVVLGCVLVCLRRFTANIVLRAVAWVKADCQHRLQQLSDAPLPLQVAGVLFVFNGVGIAALETYNGILDRPCYISLAACL